MTDRPATPQTSRSLTHADTTNATVPDDGADRGTLTIADKVIERIASLAAREVRSVTDTGTKWSLPLASTNLPKATAKVAGGRTRINVEVAAQWPASASETAAQVRDHVQDRVSVMTGMTVDAVDVTIADFVHVETQRRRVQ